MEEWLEIKSAPGYEVSSLGQIKNKKSDRLVPTRVGPTGQVSVNLMIRGRQRTRSVASLVARAFIGEPEFPTAVVRCKDGNRQNLVPKNLVWALKPRRVVWHDGDHHYEMGPWRELDNEQG